MFFRGDYKVTTDREVLTVSRKSDSTLFL